MAHSLGKYRPGFLNKRILETEILQQCVQYKKILKKHDDSNLTASEKSFVLPWRKCFAKELKEFFLDGRKYTPDFHWFITSQQISTLGLMTQIEDMKISTWQEETKNRQSKQLNSRELNWFDQVMTTLFTYLIFQLNTELQWFFPYQFHRQVTPLLVLQHRQLTSPPNG